MDNQDDLKKLNNTESASDDDKHHTQESDREERDGTDSTTCNNNRPASNDDKKRDSRGSERGGRAGRTEGTRKKREEEKAQKGMSCDRQVADNKERIKERAAPIKGELGKETSPEDNLQDNSDRKDFEQVEDKETCPIGGRCGVSQEDSNIPVQRRFREDTLRHGKDSQALSGKPGLDIPFPPASNGDVTVLAIQSPSFEALTVTDPSTGAISKRCLGTPRPANETVPSQNTEPSALIPSLNTQPPNQTSAVSANSQEPLSKSICEMNNNEESRTEIRHENVAGTSFFKTNYITMVNLERLAKSHDKKCDVKKTFCFNSGNFKTGKAHRRRQPVDKLSEQASQRHNRIDSPPRSLNTVTTNAALTVWGSNSVVQVPLSQSSFPTSPVIRHQRSALFQANLPPSDSLPIQPLINLHQPVINSSSEGGPQVTVPRLPAVAAHSHIPFHPPAVPLYQLSPRASVQYSHTLTYGAFSVHSTAQMIPPFHQPSQASFQRQLWVAAPQHSMCLLPFLPAANDVRQTQSSLCGPTGIIRATAGLHPQGIFHTLPAIFNQQTSVSAQGLQQQLSASAQGQPPHPQGMHPNQPAAGFPLIYLGVDFRRGIQLAEATEESSPAYRGAVNLRDGAVDLGDHNDGGVDLGDHNDRPGGFFAVGIMGADNLQLRDHNHDVNGGAAQIQIRRPRTRQDRIRNQAQSFPPDQFLTPHDLLTMINEERMTRGQQPIIPDAISGQCHNCHTAPVNSVVIPCYCYAFCTGCAQQLAQQTAACPRCRIPVEFFMDIYR